MLTRRSFLKLIGIAAAASVVVPALQIGRSPYVTKGDVVDFIGHRPGGFGGGCGVVEVHPWDGVGYPVDVRPNIYGVHVELERYYDADLADMRREVPYKFWHDPANKKYPNVHIYIRVQRFGETMEQAVRQLNFYSASRA